jgi:hypothetical protein
VYLVIDAFVLIFLSRQRDAEQVLACIDADNLIDDPTIQHRCEVNQNPLDWTPRFFSERDKVATAIYILPNYGHVKVLMCCVSGSRLVGFGLCRGHYNRSVLVHGRCEVRQSYSLLASAVGPALSILAEEGTEVLIAAAA